MDRSSVYKSDEVSTTGFLSKSGVVNSFLTPDLRDFLTFKWQTTDRCLYWITKMCIVKKVSKRAD